MDNGQETARGARRARAYGVTIGMMETGRWNALTDVPGVRVGHCTVAFGAGALVPGQGPARTGVTAILPHDANLFREKVPAASHVINGFGKSIGLVQVDELGAIETPILLTSVLNISRPCYPPRARSRWGAVRAAGGCGVNRGRIIGSMRHRLYTHAAIACALIAALLLCPLALSAEGEQSAEAATEPQVTAASAAVVELSTGGILWGRDIHATRPPASVTKMMTALVAFDAGPLDTKVTIQQSDLVGESSMGLEVGETITVEALLYGMLLPSGNDAATALARTYGRQPGDTTGQQSVLHFVDRMNAKAKALGTKETHFANPHGLDEPTHVTSAADFALIGAAFASNPLLMRVAGTVTYDGFGHTVHTTNKLLYDGRYPSVVGGKTGLTDDAGYTLVEIASKDGRQILSVELGTTADAFWTDAMRLLAYGYAIPAPITKSRPLQKRHVTAPIQGTTLLTANLQQPPMGDSNAASATLTLPPTHHPRGGTILRVVLFLFLSLIISGVMYARRLAVRRAFDEMRQEWRKALADPAHLVVTGPMPIITVHRSPGAPAASSRWADEVQSPRQWHDVARAYALQAVRHASGGNRPAAQQSFKHAVSLSPRLEWGTIPGFWELPPVSYADLAIALIDAGHPAIARSMLTVASLAFPRHPDLREIEARLSRRPTPTLIATAHDRRR